MKQESSDDSDGDRMSLGRNRNAVQALDWMARNAPGQFIPYLDLAELLFDDEELNRMDFEGEDIAINARKVVYGTRDLLRRDHGRELILSESGARTAINGDEQAKCVIDDVRRYAKGLDRAPSRLQASEERGVNSPEAVKYLAEAAGEACDVLKIGLHRLDAGNGNNAVAA